jgi:hypothetical protein
MGPEVYLKSLSMARNIATQRGEEIRYFTTANFDLIQFDDFRDEGKPYEAHYYHRPKKTILVRTVKDGGESFHIQGDFDRTVPNLYLQVVTKLFFKKEKSPLSTTPLPPFGKGDGGRGVVSKEIIGIK